MNFLLRIKTRALNSKDPLDRLSNWIAENPSQYSARSENRSWLPHYSTAREALVICFLSLFTDPWESWEIRERLANSSYFHRYDSDWNKVQLMLQQVQDLESLEEFVTEQLGLDDFFGNFLRQANKILKRNPNSWFPTVRDEKKPKRQNRHRGYRDKGSLRPYDKRGRNLGETNAGRDDRQKIQYRYLNLRMEMKNLTKQVEI